MTKDRRLQIAAFLFAWTLGVYLAGPVVTALVRALTFQASVARMDDQARTHARYVAAERLLGLYDARNPPPLVLDRIALDYCGYERPSDDAAQNGSEYLWEAALRSANRFQQQARTERFTAALSDFGLVFLGNCISSTVFAHRCERDVGRILERNGIRFTRDLPSGSPDQHEQTMQDAVNCRYMDGLAARAEQPLAKVQH